MIIDGGIAESDVVPDGAVEQHHFLGQNADAPAQIRLGHLADIHAAELHRPFGGLVKSDEQFAQRGLARSHAPDDAHAFAGTDTQADAVQRGPLRPG